MSGDISEIEWVAFQYLAGELNSADAEAFELLLATDQSARESLASATQVVQSAFVAIPSVEESSRKESHEKSHSVAVLPASPRRSGWIAPLAWMATGAAACLATFLIVRPTFDSGSGLEVAEHPVSGQRVDITMDPAVDVEKLALLWSDSEQAMLPSDGWQPDWSQPSRHHALRPDFELFAPEFGSDAIDSEDGVATLDQQNSIASVGGQVDNSASDATSYDRVNEDSTHEDGALAIPGWLLAAVSVEQEMPEQPVEEN